MHCNDARGRDWMKEDMTRGRESRVKHAKLGAEMQIVDSWTAPNDLNHIALRRIAISLIVLRTIVFASIIYGETVFVSVSVAAITIASSLVLDDNVLVIRGDSNRSHISVEGAVLSRSLWLADATALGFVQVAFLRGRFLLIEILVIILVAAAGQTNILLLAWGRLGLDWSIAVAGAVGS
jgi:hypothetical protein